MRRARQIQHEQTRRESEDYLEMVMFSGSWNEILSLFDGYFGSALKAAGEEADETVEAVANRFGGITKEQVLYHTSRDNAEHVAMIWPWSDGKRMTVKILQECQ
jgi:hypothetical protein